MNLITNPENTNPCIQSPEYSTKDGKASVPLQILSSRQFLDWLKAENISLAFSTYQTSRLGFIGVNPKGNLSGFERIFSRSMGLYTTSETIYLSTKYQIWKLENVLSKGQVYNGYDKLYIPRIGYTTGDLDIHDLVVDVDGRILFINTHCNCIATISDRHSCIPLWHPPFISKIINEDRCHLNGLAMVDGKARYVTAVSQTDVVSGWREKRRDGGCIIDINTNEIITKGLSMPHSPRWYQEKLWVLNSGRGEFGYLDLNTGKFEPIAFCPGYLRGLAFWKQWAIVGLSKPRSDDKTFSGLDLDDRLREKDVAARCGFMVIDLHTGAVVHEVQLEGVITELYDVQVLPQTSYPMALGFKTDEISQFLTLEPMGTL